MKILLLADEAEATLWERLNKKRLEGVELVLSCGDLPSSYLSFLTCFTTAPVMYIRGNHDTSYEKKPPEGCECLDDQLVTVNGIRILGLGGSMRYKPGDCQYTDDEMGQRVRKLYPKIRRAGGIDILLTHAPARGIGDDTDLCHRGFETFLTVMDLFQPQVMAHGHVHKSYTAHFVRERKHGTTRVINAFGAFIIDIEPGEVRQYPFFLGKLLKEHHI